MAEPNQQSSSIDLSSAPVKRKRGRPRKDETSSSDHIRRIQKRRVLSSSSSDYGLVGQEVSGVLDGVFDSGYFLTVRVGDSGPVLRGMVFDSRLSVPVSAENDIAPYLPMLKRDRISTQGSISSHAGMMQNAIPVEPIQAKEPPVHVQVTPSKTTQVPQTESETLEPKSASKFLEVSLKGAAGQHSELSRCHVSDDHKKEASEKTEQLSWTSEEPSTDLKVNDKLGTDRNLGIPNETEAKGENFSGFMGLSSRSPRIAVTEKPEKDQTVLRASTSQP